MFSRFGLTKCVGPMYPGGWKTSYSVRFYTYTELRALLLDVGFAAVAAVGHDGEPLTLESRRMLVVATR